MLEMIPSSPWLLAPQAFRVFFALRPAESMLKFLGRQGDVWWRTVSSLSEDIENTLSIRVAWCWEWRRHHAVIVVKMDPCALSMQI